MSTGEWLPEREIAKLGIETEQLRKLAAISAGAQLDEITSALSDAEQQWLANAMRAGRQAWRAAAEPLDDSELRHLIKCLAIAEMRIDGCTVGPESPVIHVHSLLKERGHPLGKAELLWLKQHCSNRFLPNGPLI